MTHEIGTLAFRPRAKAPRRSAVRILVAACSVLLVIGARAARAGVNVWTSNGPYVGCVYALAIDPQTPSTLYAATDAGVFKSTNSGGSWTAVNTGLNSLSVDALAINPTTPGTLYGGTDAGVFDIELAPACIVGTGTSASCTEAALDACLPGGASFNGAVTFDCGSEPVTITVTGTKTISADATIDGGSLITISGGNSVGVFFRIKVPRVLEREGAAHSERPISGDSVNSPVNADYPLVHRRRH